MTQDQRHTSPEHGHLKDSLKKQGRSDQLAEKIAEQTVTQAEEKTPAGQASPTPVQVDRAEEDRRENSRSPEQASQGTPKDEEAAKAQRRRK